MKLLVYFPNTHNNWDQVRLILGDRNSIWVFYQEDRDSSMWAITCSCPGCTILDQK